MYTNDGIKFEAEWEDDILIKNNIQILNQNGDIFIGEVCKEENIEDENIDFKFEKNTKIYNFEEKLNFIDNYFSGAESKFEDLEEYDEDIGQEVYNIKDMYHLWKIGKQKWENQKKYINATKKLLFFKEFYKNLFCLDEYFKSKINEKVNDLFKEFLYIRKFLIFKFKIKLIVNNIENIEIIEKNYLNFNEIDFFQGIIVN